MPAQFKANSLTDIEGTLRKYDSMDFRLYYSDNVASYPESNVPSLAAPPEIAQVTSITDTNTVTFTVRVTSDPSVGVQEVWVTYTGASGPFYGTWQSLDLTQDVSDSTVWTGVLSLPPGQTWDNVRFTVQAVNGVGLVTLVTNFGNYFIPGIDPGQTSSDGTAYQSDLDLAARQRPVWHVGDVQRPVGKRGCTCGRHSWPDRRVQLRLAATPGGHKRLRAGHRLLPADRSCWTGRHSGVLRRQRRIQGIERLFGVHDLQAKHLVNAYAEPAAGQYSDDTNLQATLIAGADRRLSNTTVFFVAGTLAETLSATSTNITDYAGRAPAGPVNLPAGVYPVTAYFLGTIPVGGGQTVTLSDSRFIASTGAGSLVQTAEDATVAYTGRHYGRQRGSYLCCCNRHAGRRRNAGRPDAGSGAIRGAKRRQSDRGYGYRTRYPGRPVHSLNPWPP